MLSIYRLSLLFLLLTVKLILTEESTTESVLSLLPQMIHEDTYQEIRDKFLPVIRRASRNMQSMIIKITEEYTKIQKYKDVINQTCLSSSLVVNMTKLSRNLTRIMQEEVPSIEEEVNHILSDIEELKKKVDELTYDVKQQPVPQFNHEQLQRLQILKNIYEKLNSQLNQINQQLKQILNEIIHPGLASVEKYNACLASVAQSLIDYGINEIVEHMDDDDDDDKKDVEQLALEHSSSTINHTDLIVSFINESEYVILDGLCPTVGVVGFTLGGGYYAMYSRSYGLAYDNVLNFTVASYNGTIVTVSSLINLDLYWALRGGGGGDFGFVLERTQKIHRITETKIPNAALKNWSTFLKDIADNDTRISFNTIVIINGRSNILIMFCSFNGPEEEIASLFGSWLSKYPRPTFNSRYNYSQNDIARELAIPFPVVNREHIASGWLLILLMLC
ncbi:hypothetical protein I4U23_003763 [Adineta vaga]|nr:hypothetical protein I4U23_003763 [Adineta vaga]